jgi:hypothetical protein
MYEDLEYLRYKLNFALDRPNPNIATVWRLQRQVALMEEMIFIYQSLKVTNFGIVKVIKRHSFEN